MAVRGPFSVEEISIHVRSIPGGPAKRVGGVSIANICPVLRANRRLLGPPPLGSESASAAASPEPEPAPELAVAVAVAGGGDSATERTFELQIDRHQVWPNTPTRAASPLPSSPPPSPPPPTSPPFSSPPPSNSGNHPLTGVPTHAHWTVQMKGAAGLAWSVDSRWLLHWHWPQTDRSGEQVAAIAEGLGLSQWVCAAAPLPCPGRVAAVVAGRAYCFLPLPIDTGLALHVNAAFALSSNRRDLWQAQDATGVGALKGQWNKFLLEQALPAAYSGLLRRLGEHIGTGEVDRACM